MWTGCEEELVLGDGRIGARLEGSGVVVLEDEGSLVYLRCGGELSGTTHVDRQERSVVKAVDPGLRIGLVSLDGSNVA